MKRIIYPGTFDPLHYGHIDITKRAAKLFDEVHICISDNLHKNPLFSHEERMDMIEECVHDISNVYVHSNPENLVIRFAKEQDAVAIIRGFYFLPISNPAEIFDNNIHIPIIGVIPKADNIEATNEDIGFKTAIETLIVNINSIQNAQLEKNIITITSASPFNGKSTISRKLAESLSKLGKKVLLIDISLNS